MASEEGGIMMTRGVADWCYCWWWWHGFMLVAGSELLVGKRYLGRKSPYPFPYHFTQYVDLFTFCWPLYASLFLNDSIQEGYIIRRRLPVMHWPQKELFWLFWAFGDWLSLTPNIHRQKERMNIFPVMMGYIKMRACSLAPLHGECCCIAATVIVIIFYHCHHHHHHHCHCNFSISSLPPSLVTMVNGHCHHCHCHIHCHHHHCRCSNSLPPLSLSS